MRIHEGRARITDKSSRVCMEVAVDQVVAVHGNPEGQSLRVVLTGGQEAVLENVEPRHVYDMIWPRPDAPASGVGYEPPASE